MSITYVSKKMKSVETVLNKDLKITSEWLKANRLFLNVNKSKLFFLNLNENGYIIMIFQLRLMDAKWNPLTM